VIKAMGYQQLNVYKQRYVYFKQSCTHACTHTRTHTSKEATSTMRARTPTCLHVFLVVLLDIYVMPQKEQ